MALLARDLVLDFEICGEMVLCSGSGPKASGIRSRQYVHG